MQFLGKVVELPLLCNDRCLGLTMLSRGGALLQYIDSRRHPCCGGPDSACGAAADAVFSTVVEISVVAQRQGWAAVF